MSPSSASVPFESAAIQPLAAQASMPSQAPEAEIAPAGATERLAPAVRLLLAARRNPPRIAATSAAGCGGANDTVPELTVSLQSESQRPRIVSPPRSEATSSPPPETGPASVTAATRDSTTSRLPASMTSGLLTTTFAAAGASVALPVTATVPEPSDR